MRINGSSVRRPQPASTSPKQASSAAVKTSRPTSTQHVSSFEAPRRATGTVAKVVATAIAASPKPPPPAKEKSFWDKLKDTAASVVKTVSNAAAKVVTTVSNAAAKVVTTVSNAAAKVVTTVSNAAAKVVTTVSNAAAKVVKVIAPRIGDAARSLVTGAVNTVVGVGRNLIESLTTVGSGVGKIFRGDLVGGLKSIGSGLVKGLVQTPFDAVLMMGGRALSAVQTLVGLEPPGRSLSPAELAEAKKVYGDTIDFSRVQVKAGDIGVFGGSGRPFVHGDTIYVPTKALNPDGSIPMETLVHEMGHVWQHQTGGTDYMSEALWAQKFGDAYKWKKGLDEGKTFAQLDPEQKAELISTAYKAGYFDHPSQGFHVDGTDYTAQLEAALADIKAGRGAP